MEKTNYVLDYEFKKERYVKHKNIGLYTIKQNSISRQFYITNNQTRIGDFKYRILAEDFVYLFLILK